MLNTLRHDKFPELEYRYLRKQDIEARHGGGFDNLDIWGDGECVHMFWLKFGGKFEEEKIEEYLTEARSCIERNRGRDYFRCRPN